MKILVSNILIMLVLAACTSDNKTHSSDADSANHATHEHDGHSDPRVTAVMATHDSLMSSMGAIMNLKRTISTDIKTTDSLLTVKSNAILIKRKEEALAVTAQLENADKEMMNWMHQYKADTLEKLSEQQATAYITDQKLKIEAVRAQMNKSIGSARAFLDKKQNL